MNSLKEAIRRRRLSKAQDLDTMGDDKLEQMNEETQESGLAPEIKERGEGAFESEMQMPIEETQDMQEHLQQRMQMIPKQRGEGNPELSDEDMGKMYQPGDENMKGFMGKAALKMKQKFGR